MIRQYELSVFKGTRAEYRTIQQRRALIGKRIGYDVRGSCMSHYGRVTDARGKELEIDGMDWISVSTLQQVAVLDDQN